MGTPRRKEIERHLPEGKLDTLIADASDHHELRRLIFLKCLYQGDTLERAAQRVGRSGPTGSRWADRWNEGGLDALLPDFGGGRPAKLDADDRERLVERLEQEDSWTIDGVCELLDEQFGVTYHPAYLRRFLRTLGVEDRIQ